jgi:hypothetical protein
MLSIAEWIGIYGGVVATGVFVWNIVKNRPNIKIAIGRSLDKKSEKYDITARLINKSIYPIKLYSYGFIKIDYYRLLENISHNVKDKMQNAFFNSQPIYVEIEIPGRDHHDIHFTIDDISLESENNEVHILNTFVIVDRTGRIYKKKIPGYILEQAQITPNRKKV